MINRIHPSHNREQDLRCTNIRSRFFSSNVLFSRLQRHAIGWITRSVYRGTNYSSRHLSFELILGGKESSMWSAESHGNSKSLTRAHYYVGTHFAGSFHQHQTH